jgi:hypothetical protein
MGPCFAVYPDSSSSAVAFVCCSRPGNAKSKPSFAGAFDPQYEISASLAPNLVGNYANDVRKLSGSTYW